MILKDSQVRVVSFVDETSRCAVLEGLLSHQLNYQVFNTLSHEETDTTKPIIWLALVDSIDAIANADMRHYHANHEQILYIICQQRTCILPTQFSQNSVFLSAGMTSIILAIEYAEQRILQRQHFLPSDIDAAFTKLHFYGRSPTFLKAANVIKKVSNTDTNVFIKGETGTGKELTARTIHYLSDRKEEAFIPINCGAFSDDLILSELFGHEKGAFTGADKSKVGLLEMAHNGTVFLDEVDSLSLKAQVALLRYLQDFEVRRLGSREFKKLNVRIIAASNADMPQKIKSGEFREDLMYRLDVLQVILPTLRKRGEDIQLLAQHFLASMALRNKNQAKVFHPSLIAAMKAHHWEGNVRELDNFVKRAYVLSDGYVIDDASILSSDADASGNTPSDDGQSGLACITQSFQSAKDKLIYQFEHDYLAKLLTHTHGNISKAAQIAKKERRSFCRLMAKHGFERRQFLS